VAISTDAVAALIGAALGFASSTRSQLVLTRRLERRDVRAEVRTVLAELVNARSLIRTFHDNPQLTWSLAAPYVNRDKWTLHSHSLAREPRLDYPSVTVAYIGIEGIQTVGTIGRPEESLFDDALRALDEGIEHLKAFLNELGRWRPVRQRTRTPSPDS
jgi:hypothetical protein